MANKTKAPRALVLNAARKEAFAGVRQAAFNSGVSRTVLVNATAATLGKKPSLALYTGAKLEIQIGYMAAYLARKGDNREPVALMEHCRSRLTKYAKFGGTAALKKGQAGRRTKADEDAYASARVLISGLMKDAGVTVPDPRGGDTSKTRNAQTPKGATKTAAKAANDAKPAIQRFKAPADVLAYAALQSKAMLSTINRNAAIAPVALKSAVEDFAKAIKAINA